MHGLQLPEFQKRSKLIRKWLSPAGREATCFSADHDKILQDRVQESCQWILYDEIYLNWRERTSSGFLWIYGDPGLGKTFLASSIIDSLSQETTVKQLPRVIYFYCRYSDEQKNTLAAVLQSLLLQLFELKPNNLVIWNELNRLRQATVLGHATADSLPLLIQAVMAVTAEFFAPRCIIDGLDELDDPVELTWLLLELQMNSESTFSVVIISRKEDTISNVLSKIAGVTTLQVTVEDTQKDVSKYVQGRLTGVRSIYAGDPTLYERIRESLDSSEGVLFMWARLMLDEFENKFFSEDA